MNLQQPTEAVQLAFTHPHEADKGHPVAHSQKDVIYLTRRGALWQAGRKRSLVVPELSCLHGGL